MWKGVATLATVGIFLLLTFIVILVLFPLFPPFRGFYHTRTVLTGSMKPTIAKGSLIINKWIKAKEIRKGDVITFRNPNAANIFITHRVYKVESTLPLYHFQTKGDANNAPDGWTITQAGIEGKVILTVPFIGYLIEFFKTPLGFAIFVVLPLGSFILREIFELKKIIKETRSKRKNKGNKKSEDYKKRVKTRETATILLFAFSAIISIFASRATFAAFNSNNGEVGNINLQTASVFPGDVVINEVMWMGAEVGGSENPNDEWIELRNLTTQTFDLTGWVIEGAGSGSGAITLSGFLPAGGFFLVSHYDSTSANSALADTVSVDQVQPGISLKNSGEKLTLKNALGTIIDETPTGPWPAGIDGPPTWHSMERNDDPATGWHSCDSQACSDQRALFWDSVGNNYGTPKAANLSENDPSLPPPTPAAVSPSPTASPTAVPTVPSAITPTPQAEPEPTLNFYLRADKKAVGFKVENVADFETLSYEISYGTDKGTKGMMGKIEINKQEAVVRENLLLGTCSAVEGVVCVYDEGITTLRLKITLKNSVGEKVLEKEISYN